jgi:hypothetical protein
MTKISLALCFALVGAAFSGCASAPPPPPPVAAAPAAKSPMDVFRDPSAPAWIKKSCGAFFGDKKRAICGVGIVAGMTNPGLASAAAESRGRAQIARVLNTRVKNMMKDYQSGVQGGPGNKLSNEQYLTATTKDITSMSLSGVRLEDTWASSDGTLFALMILDLDSFRDQVKNMSQLDEQVRKVITENAEKSFAEMEESTEKTLPPIESVQQESAVP